MLAFDTGRIEKDVFADFYGLDSDNLHWHIDRTKGGEQDERETFYEAKKRIFETLMATELLFVSAYLRLEKKESNAGWQGGPNYMKFDGVYKFLCELGYEMSDEEKALQDGTHELYLTNEVNNGD